MKTIRESADLLYNLAVLWAACGVRPVDVWQEMERREHLLGIAEKMPKSPVKLDLVIQAGDTISAEVKYLGNNTYQLTLDDVTSGHSSTIQVESSKPIRSSAEWIRLATPPGRRKRLLW